jgi:endoglucanase
MAEQNNKPNPTFELIKRLSLPVGVTGYTGPNSIQPAVAAELSPYVDRVEQDRMGSVIGVKAGRQTPAEGQPRRKVMLAAHLDEIGAMVTHLEREFIRFAHVGGLDDRVLMGQEVTVHGRRDLPGVIGSIAPHLLPAGEDRSAVKLAEMFIDVGLTATETAQLVRPGDIVSFRRTPTELLGGNISAKALDNRASVAIMALVLQELQKLQHAWDVFAVATASEEVGRYPGAVTSAYAIRPDVAIALDVTFADTDGVTIELNKGPVLCLGPSNHPAIRQRLVDSCAALEMKYQTEVLASGAGTDAFPIEISREGVPVVLVGLPSRYMHSPVEVVSAKDVERIARLLAHFIAGLDEAFIRELTPAL